MRRKLSLLLAIAGGLAVVVIAGSLLLVTGLAGVGQETSTPSANNEPNSPGQAQAVQVIGVIETSQAPFDEGKYTEWSTRIVRGKVTAILPGQWDEDHKFVETPFLVSVTRHIKGNQPQQPQLTLYVYGGTIGNQQWVASDAPKISVGEEGLFFAWSSPSKPSEKLYLTDVVRIEGSLAFAHRVGPTKAEPLDQIIGNVEAAMRGEFHPTPTPTWAPPPTQIPSGGLYPPKPPRPVKPGE